MDVVVPVLASNDRVDLTSGAAVDASGGVGVASLLLGEASLNLVVVTVLVAAMLDGDDVGVMLLRKDLTVGNRLLSGVVVILVNLLVDSGSVLLVLGLLDGLVLNGRGDLLVDGGVVVTRRLHEVLDSSLCGIHDG